MINKIWAFFIIVGSLFLIKSNNYELLNNEILISSKKAFELILRIFPVLALWLGITKIAEESGLLKKLSKKLSFLLKFIFPDIPKNHESLDYICCNVIANMLGLGSAATPFGLKAMQSLQSINKNKNIASRSMITFLVLNTSGVTLIPTTLISLRIMYNSINPNIILIPCIIITIVNTLLALIIDRIFAKCST